MLVSNNLLQFLGDVHHLVLQRCDCTLHAVLWLVIYVCKTFGIIVYLFTFLVSQDQGQKIESLKYGILVINSLQL